VRELVPPYVDFMKNKELASNRISKKNLINIDIEEGDRGFYAGRWVPRTLQEELALELALTLQDRKGLPFYIHCANEYSEAFLRGILDKVMGIPEKKIKKSRGALFNFLVQHEDWN
jgi:hypothetical protein